MPKLIYKICSQSEWKLAREAGVYRGSHDDERDGFIHFSLASQLRPTADKHFAGRSDLWLLAVDAEALGPALRYEPSRGGQLFPHLYAALPVAAVLWHAPLPGRDEPWPTDDDPTDPTDDP